MGKKSFYSTGGGIRSVSKAPDWLLKIIGKSDANQGEYVVNAHIDRMLDQCTAIEAKECLAMENFLSDFRKQGADALFTIKINAKKLDNMPEALEERNACDIRRNIERKTEIQKAETAIINAKKKLFEINESLCKGEVILHERIIKTRKKARSKIDLYVKGVRSGDLKDFSFEIIFDTSAVDAYHNKHKQLDDAIKKFAAAYFYEEGFKL